MLPNLNRTWTLVLRWVMRVPYCGDYQVDKRWLGPRMKVYFVLDRVLLVTGMGAYHMGTQSVGAARVWAWCPAVHLQRTGITLSILCQYSYNTMSIL